ncbi:MAG: hypothetical protein EZS28_000890 [Streblomastix strix]|uniref:Uncharacterized protein n=1 Tax=Streblomastix strix TaxID=222440 RepID=A0A5J4X8L1_9EUKA|nr:MAG: hypothetical protein EZS28_000890 [Streblomastix strix]
MLDLIVRGKSPRHEKERGNNEISQERMTDELCDANVENAVSPWMHSLLGKQSNSKQVRALKQQLEAQTMINETDYRKNAEQLDPTGERATEQKVNALLARQKEIIGLELNRVGVKQSMGVDDTSEEIETAQLAVLIQFACVSGSAALIQGDFVAIQRFFLTCHHAARMITGEAQRRREMTLVGKEFKGLLAKDGDALVF